MNGSSLLVLALDYRLFEGTAWPTQDVSTRNGLADRKMLLIAIGDLWMPTLDSQDHLVDLGMSTDALGSTWTWL